MSRNRWTIYCVRCDSFQFSLDGRQLLEEGLNGQFWCHVCEEWAQLLPKRVKVAIARAEDPSIVGSPPASIVPPAGA